jgi:transketolase
VRPVGQGRERHQAWTAAFESYASAHPEPAAEFRRPERGEAAVRLGSEPPHVPADPKGVATRKAGEAVVQALAERLPEMVGGSADLNPSTFTWIKKAGDFEAPGEPPAKVQGRVGGAWGREGRNLHFGIREHAMGSAVNGLAVHGGFIPYGSTFLVFSDYMRPPIRCRRSWRWAACGCSPTTASVSAKTARRISRSSTTPRCGRFPDLLFIRPCDANETVEAWRVAIRHRTRPTILALTRQNVPRSTARGSRRRATSRAGRTSSIRK